MARREYLIYYLNVRHKWTKGSHKFKEEIINGPKCSCKVDDETLDHVLWQCNLYNDEGLKLIEKRRKINF